MIETVDKEKIDKVTSFLNSLGFIVTQNTTIQESREFLHTKYPEIDFKNMLLRDFFIWIDDIQEQKGG